jgi:hypothetical protein
MTFTRPILALAALAVLCGAETYPERYAVIVAGGTATTPAGTPVVTDVLNSRVPSEPLVVSVSLPGAVAVKATVHWSSPNGSNDFGPVGDFVPVERKPRYDANIDAPIAVYRHLDAVGGAVVVADVGPPVDQRATLYVENRAGIGFGCYGFIRDGPSVRIVDGRALSASLATSDVAVVGPGNPAGVGPGYGCWGENYDPNLSEFRLVFAKGGRLGHGGRFLKEIPLAAFDAGRPLEIEAADGHTYTIHGRLYAGAYVEAWIESPQDNPSPDGTPFASPSGTAAFARAK